jgi:hypothetical protein
MSTTGIVGGGFDFGTDYLYTAMSEVEMEVHLIHVMCFFSKKDK